MGKKRQQRIPSLSRYEPLKFELEEDSERLFIEFLDADPNLQPGSDPPLSPGTCVSPPAPRGGKSERRIDLHGLNLRQAMHRVEAEILKLLASGPRVVSATVVTGKGLHSGSDGSILAREIHHFVSARFKRQIIRIQESPGDLLIGGIPIRGHFQVTLQRH